MRYKSKILKDFIPKLQCYFWFWWSVWVMTQNGNKEAVCFITIVTIIIYLSCKSYQGTQKIMQKKYEKKRKKHTKTYKKHLTRLSSNLRPTTRECVHLVTRGHCRSREKDGGHAIRSAVAENHMLHANLMALFYRSGVMADNSLHCRNTHFRPVCSSDLYLDPMTFK